MTKIIGKGLLQPYSQEIFLPPGTLVRDLPSLLGLTEEHSSVMIVVRDHTKLDFEDVLDDKDEIILFMAVMGG